MNDRRSQRRPQGDRSHLTVLAVVALILLGAFAAGYYKPVRLGLDLQGGLELVLKANPTTTKKISDEDMVQAVEVIRSRVDELGTAETEIRRQGTDQIAVELPGEQDPNRAVAIVGKTAQLRFYQFEKYLVGKKIYRNSYDLLKRNQKRAEESLKEAGKKVSPQYYLYDSNNEEIAGPGASEKRLIESAVDLLEAQPEGDRPAGWESLNDGKLPKGWQTLLVPIGEVMLHGEPDQIMGGGGDITIAQGGKFDRTKGAYLLMEDKPALEGSEIKSATPQASRGQWATGIVFSRKGAKQFGKVTKQIADAGQIKGTPQRFAVVLDDEIKSVPQIDYQQYPNGIQGNQAEISGADNRQEAADLASVLKTGALPVRFEVISKTQVSATLGDQSLEEGLRAGAAGLLVVMIYLVLFYRVLGLLADVALLAFAMLFYGLVVSIPITLTLPGIAGMILTIGVAADANIIIFERIREEYRAGRSVPQAIRDGYRKGFLTIIDANIVTMITAFVLFAFAIGTVRGFALQLGIGVVLSFITAVALTHALLGLVASIPMFQKRWVIGGSRREMRFHIPWMTYRKHMMIFVVGLMVAMFAATMIKGLNLGVDFKSGTKIDLRTQKTASTESIRTTLAAVDESYSRAVIQETAQAVSAGQKKTPKGTSFAIRIEKLRVLASDAADDTEATRSGRAEQRIEDALDKKYGVVPETFQVQTIGPSFGKQVLEAAIIAVILSLLLETLYIWYRFEFKYAVPVLASLLHDGVVVLGIYALSGQEFKATTVAALLTILGFSLYDTIIVLDRIRENVHLLRKSSFRRIVTVSLNEVLTRSLNTTVVVVMPVLALYIFGGETLKDFAFALLVGTVFGAYSSLIVAAPLLSYIKEREPEWRRRSEAEHARELETGEHASATDAAGAADVDSANGSQRPTVNQP